MTESLVKALVDPWSSRWKSTAVGSSLLFWISGAAGYLLTHDVAQATCRTTGGKPLWCGLAAYQGLRNVLLPVAAVALVAGAAGLAQRLSAPTLAVLSGGGWIHRRPFRPVARFGIWVQTSRRRLIKVPGQLPAGATPAAAVLNGAEKDQALVRHRRFADPPAPTAIGNEFGALSERVQSEHGLDLKVCWLPLVRVLPSDTRTELANLSTTLVLSVQAFLFALAMPLWVFVLQARRGPLGLDWRIWWGVASLVIILGAYRAVRSAATEVAEASETAVTLYRVRLYDALGFERPTDTVAEPDRGREVSDYLNRSLAVKADLKWRYRATP